MISLSIRALTGDKRFIHPIVHWLLANFDQHKKKAYLAQYCVPFEVPEDILQDEAVFDLYQQYKEQQAQFKAMHSHLENLRSSSVSPAELKREIQQLDSERDHLVQKIQQFKNKTTNMQGFNVLLNATSMLRKEQEEEARIRDKIMEQRLQLDQTQAFYLDSSRALHQVRDAQKSRDQSAAEKAMAEVKADATGDVDSPQFVCIFPTSMLCEQGAMEGVTSVLGSDTPVVGIGTLVQFSSTTAPSTTGLAAVLCWPSVHATAAFSSGYAPREDCTGTITKVE